MYNKINERVSLFVTRDILDKVDDDWRKDFLDTSPEKPWAQQMLEKLDNESYLRQKIVPGLSTGSGNILNRWCIVAQALSPNFLQEDERDFAGELYLSLHSQFLAISQLAATDIPADILGYESGEWIIDAIGHLMDLVEDGASELDDEVRAMFLDDLNGLYEDMNLTDETAEERRIQVLQSFAVAVTQISQILQGLGSIMMTWGPSDRIHKAINLAFQNMQNFSLKRLAKMRGFLTVGAVSVPHFCPPLLLRLILIC